MTTFYDFYEFKDALGVKNLDTELTPELVAERFHKTLEHWYSWQPVKILKFISENKKYGTLINPADVLQAYDNAIRMKVERVGIESEAGPIGHLIIKYIAGDDRLRSAVSAEHIQKRFQDATAAGDWHRAFIVFQSTVHDLDLRQAVFSPKEVGALFKKLSAADNMRLIVDFLEITQDDARSRACITPQMFGTVFHKAVDLAESESSDTHYAPHYAFMALCMLRYTVGDDRLRSGITPTSDVWRLHHYYEFKQEADVFKSRIFPPSESERKHHKKISQFHIREFLAYTLDNPDQETVNGVFNEFRRLAKSKSELSFLHRPDAYLAAAAVKRYLPGTAHHP